MSEATHSAGQAPVLQVQDLSLVLRARNREVPVLNAVSFTIQPGETLCLVGESGCGKSMTALAIMRLIPPQGRIAAGCVRLRDTDLAGYDDDSMRRVRGNAISMIFQEPMTALNPVMRIGEQIGEVIDAHHPLAAPIRRARIVAALADVGLPDPEEIIDAYPFRLSGGQRQRVMIACALILEPALLIADEPTTALDVTTQAQILTLIRQLQQRRGTAVLLITHDMGAVAEMADRVVVMYGGRVVEEGRVDAILARPAHPYTRGLIACLPELDRAPSDARPDLPEIPGVVPSLWERGAGCPFLDRCGHAAARCAESFPPLTAVGEDHGVSCWHATGALA